MSIKSKIQALITAANTKTGESDTTLTDAVQTLVDGYGQGGGGEGGLNYDLQQVEATSNTPVVDRAFDNFIFIAQVDEPDLPAKADRPRLYSYYIEAVYINDEFVSPGRFFKEVVSETAGGNYVDRSLQASVFAVSGTSITFSTKGSQNVFKGTWNVLQIELPANFPFFSFVGL